MPTHQHQQQQQQQPKQQQKKQRQQPPPQTTKATTLTHRVNTCRSAYLSKAQVVVHESDESLSRRGVPKHLRLVVVERANLEGSVSQKLHSLGDYSLYLRHLTTRQSTHE